MSDFYNFTAADLTWGSVSENLPLGDKRKYVRKCLEKIYRQEKRKNVTVEQQAEAGFTSRETMMEVIVEVIESAILKENFAKESRDFFTQQGLSPISGMSYTQSQGDMAKSFSLSVNANIENVISLDGKIDFPFTQENWEDLGLYGAHTLRVNF